MHVGISLSCETCKYDSLCTSYLESNEPHFTRIVQFSTSDQVLGNFLKFITSCSGKYFFITKQKIPRLTSELLMFDPSDTPNVRICQTSLSSRTADHSLSLSCSISCPPPHVCRVLPSALTLFCKKRKPSSIDFLLLWDQNSSIRLYSSRCEPYRETSRMHAVA